MFRGEREAGAGFPGRPWGAPQPEVKALLAWHLKRVRAALQQTEVLVRIAIRSGSWLALTLVIASFPAVALDQVDQQALARKIL